MSEINLSLNELESLAKRAARGAGYPWGLCEEAGKAVRWLCVRDLDGVAQLALLLDKTLARAADNHRPTPVQSVSGASDSTNDKLIWQAIEPLCPLATGAHLSDTAHQLINSELEIRQILLPTMLLPFAANVALLTRQTVSVVCGDTVATTDGNSIDMPKPFPDSASEVGVRCNGSLATSRTLQPRVMADNNHLQVLQHYADYTYAPATEESRLAGAGAGLSDND